MVNTVPVFLNVEIPFLLNKEKDEVVGIVGNLSVIGNWNLENSLILKPRDVNQTVWETTFSVPESTNIEYRYFIGTLLNSSDSSKKSIVVAKWETCWKSRSVVVSKKGNAWKLNDIFGIQDGEKDALTDQGWLTHEHEYRFAISSPKNSPFLEVLEENPHHQREKSNLSSAYIKLEDGVISYSSVLTTITPYDFAETKGRNEFKVLIPTTNQLHYDYCVKTLDPSRENAKFHIYSSTDQKLGTAVLACSCLPKSKGIIKLPVLNDQHSVVATIRVAYLCIKPFPFAQSMEHCFARRWKSRPMLHVGHRGSGNSFTSRKLANVWENTLASFNKASKSGADFVEFDVHLTKDGIPIVYHDLTTCLDASLKNASSNCLVSVPVHNLNLKELQSLTLRHKSRSASRNLEFDESNTDAATQPFPTLANVFENVPSQTGFNIEIKWPTLSVKNEYEDDMEHYFDANFFVDSILKVVLDSAKSRKIIFSCFDVDICIMIRRKQNKYPVLFLTNGDTLHYTPMLDLREASNEMAIGTAKAEGFLGIDTLDKDVYLNPEIVRKTHEAGLIFACYGDDVGENLDKMKKAGVDIAIYDRIYQNKQLLRRNISS